MRENSVTRRAVQVLLAAVFAALAAVGVAAPATASPAPAPAATATTAPAAVAPQPGCGDTSGYQTVALSSLPTQATDTVNLIEQGGPYPYPEDNTVFSNREKILPACASGYYHEFTVTTPGSGNRGTRRIVTGQGGEYFYTGDHYASFQLVNVDA